MFKHELPGTGGAHLRLVEEADAAELFALVDRNRAHLEPWMPWVAGTRSADDTLAFIRTTRRALADNDGLTTVLVVDGAIGGTAGFHRVDRANRATSVGYWLSADLQGRGLMTATVRALVDHAFGPWELHRVELEAAVGNARSRAVARRLGFSEEGVRRDAERHGDRWLDLVLYALLADEWPSRRGVD